MKNISDKFVSENINYEELINELGLAFREDKIFCPPKQSYDYKSSVNTQNNSLLLMPAWDNKEYVGVKLITATPNNSNLNLPYINGQYILLAASTGAPLISIDAKLITNMRTAATSVLASNYLAKKEATSVLILGNGNLAPFYIQAYSTKRNIKNIYLWGRDFEKSKEIVSSLKTNKRITVEAIEKYHQEIKKVDIISCITSSNKSLIFKEDISTGQHFDLAGSYTKEMQEVSTDVIATCSIYVDNFDITLEHSGELVKAIDEKKIKKTAIKGDLKMICQEKLHRRVSEKENTLFKCTGMAIEDLVIAKMIYKNL